MLHKLKATHPFLNEIALYQKRINKDFFSWNRLIEIQTLSVSLTSLSRDTDLRKDTLFVTELTWTMWHMRAWFNFMRFQKRTSEAKFIPVIQNRSFSLALCDGYISIRIFAPATTRRAWRPRLPISIHRKQSLFYNLIIKILRGNLTNKNIRLILLRDRWTYYYRF